MLQKLSLGKRTHHCWTKWLPFQQNIVDVCLNLREITALWQFIGRLDGIWDVMVLQHHHSIGAMNNFVTEAASVIKGRVTPEGQALPETIERVHKSFVQSSRKSVSRTG
jgi:hypothetical protein